MSERLGLTEGASLQIPSYQKHGLWQIDKRTFMKPAIAGLLLLILGALFIPACAAESVPVTSFISNVTSGTVPLSVQFIDSSENSPNSWAWSFGDGSSSTEENPAHTYTTAGTYTVVLTATNAGGSSTSTEGSYIVASAVTTYTAVTTVPATITTTVPAISPKASSVAVVASETIVPEEPASDFLNLTNIIVGIIVIVVISIAVLLFYRGPRGGRRSTWDRQL